MINIKTQSNEPISINAFTNISFAYDSIDEYKVKPVHEESADTLVKISTSKFPVQDQSGGDKSGSSSILKKRMKVRKISLCMNGNKLLRK